MRKRVFQILTVILSLFALASCLKGSRMKYPEGRDTVQSFGDGTYQILSGTYEGLNNEKYNSFIIERVHKVQKTGNKVYLIGSNVQGDVAEGRHYAVYGVIDLGDNALEICAVPEHSTDPDICIYRLDEMIQNGDVRWISAFSDFDKDDQTVFEGMTQN